jgi:2-polyprenyl-3-methyl-5-hydroxy-6-metoxy-1,4-benzoquinol methylase
VTLNPFKVTEFGRLVGLTSFLGDECVLDFGCGSGLQTLCLARRVARVVGIDIGDLTKAEERHRRMACSGEVQFIRARLQDARFHAGTFDKVFSFCVIEHIPEYRETMELCRALLKPGGEFIISVDSLHDVPGELKAEHSRRHHVQHYFEAAELRALLAECGFRDVHVEAMFRSRPARRLFCRGIERQFRYTLAETFWGWLVISIGDRLASSRADGVFLAARARR